MQVFLHKLTTFWRRKIHHQLASLVATVGITGLLSCLLIIYVLAQLSEEVLEKEAFAFDKTILLWIHSFANPTCDRIMLAIAGLGNPNTVVVIVTITLALLLWRRYYQEAKIFFVNCLGGVVLSYGLKLVFGKTRPDLWRSPITETSYSYQAWSCFGFDDCLWIFSLSISYMRSGIL